MTDDEIVSVMFNVDDGSLVELLRERFREALPLEITVESSASGVLVRGEYEVYMIYDSVLEGICKEVDND